MQHIKRKSLILLLVTVFVFSMLPTVYAADPIKLIVNGDELQPDVSPQLVEYRVMVPVRWVSEALGADVKWDQKNETVLINSPEPMTNDSDSIQLVVAGTRIEPEVAPQLINGRVMVPVRWVSEALGADVKWDQPSQTVTITSGAGGIPTDQPGVITIPNEYDEHFTLAEDELFIFIVNHGQFEMPGLLDVVIGNKLREAFPDLKIKMTVWDKPIRTTDLTAAGIAPDILLSTPGISSNWAYDMTELIEQSNIDLSKINPAALEMVKSRSNGNLYGVPIFMRETVMFYNKDVFDHFGQPYPTNGMTYDEIYELAPKLIGQVGDVTYKAITQHPDKYLNDNQLGLLPLTPIEKENPTIEEIKASVNIMTDDWLRLVENLYRFLAIPGNNFITTDDFFRKANYAMAVDEITKLPPYLMEEHYLESNDIPIFELWEPKLRNLGVASVPILSEEDNWTYQPKVMTAFITKPSTKKEQAMEVIEWLVSEEAQLQLSRNLLKAVVETDEIIEQFGADLPKVSQIEGLGDAVYWGENAYVQNYENIKWSPGGIPLWFVFRQNVLQNGDPPEIALRNAQERDIANWYGWGE